jgi:hypothetical protein
MMMTRLKIFKLDDDDDSNFLLSIESKEYASCSSTIQYSRENVCWQLFENSTVVKSISNCSSSLKLIQSDWQWIERIHFNCIAYDWFQGSNRLADLPVKTNQIPELIDSFDVPSLQRHFQNNGFHGLLTTRVSLPMSLQQCRLQLIEFLPRAVFVDEYQLRSLEQFDKSRPRATLSSAVDLEVPIYSTHAIDFAVFLTSINNKNNIQFELPLHGRYQQPKSNEQYTNVSIDAPLLLIQCDNNDTQWRPVHFLLSSESTTLHWRLPNGVSSHFTIVKWGTISTTVIGALLLILTIFFSHKR